jgi:hypothetical protein
MHFDFPAGSCFIPYPSAFQTAFASSNFFVPTVEQHALR